MTTPTCMQVSDAYEGAMAAMMSAGANLVYVNITDLLAMPGDNYAIASEPEHAGVMPCYHCGYAC